MRKPKKQEPQLVTRKQLFQKLVIDEVRKMSPEEKARAREGFDRYLGIPKKR